MTIKDLAFQATAYEKWNIINFEDFKVDELTSKLLDLDEDKLITIYNEFLRENEYDSYFENDEDTLLLLFGDNVLEGIRATHFGNYNYNDDYVKFNGYNNLDSYNASYIVDEALKDKQFKLWLFENYSEHDEVGEFIEFIEDNKDSIIKEALDLVSVGY